MSAATRTIMVHYHTFKNAGTSLDEALTSRLGPRWMAYERPRPIPPSELATFLLAHPDVIAVSSHNALLPPPEVAGARVIPIVFVRHPLDRARSIYDFERNQDVDAPGPVKARQLGLAGYLEWRLGLGNGMDRTIRDFQTARLALAGQGGTDLQRALDAVMTLPFVGLVEEYRKSVHRLEDLVRRSIPGLTIPVLRRNTTPRRAWTLTGRLRRLRRTVGPDLYWRLCDANAGDLTLWERVRTVAAREWDGRPI